MIRRIYLHNFRSFLNFEIELGPFQLLMGPNGAGKTALFDALEGIRQLVGEGRRVHEVFPPSELSTGFSAREDASMRMELDLEGNEGRYQYGLVIEFDTEQGLQRIGEEWLTYSGESSGGRLFYLAQGQAHLYRDDHSEGPVFPMDWHQSGVGFLMRSRDNTRLSWFKEQVQRQVIVKLAPREMQDESRQEASRPSGDLGNFADWYRHLQQADPECILELTEDLRERLPGFRSLRFRDAGEGKLLYADFESQSGGTHSLRFCQLSDGQRALVALYTLLHAFPEGEEAPTICIDEPENFLALPEIQPWLDQLSDTVEQGHLQVLLISHHPRLMNFLAAEQGVWLERDRDVGPTRARAIGPTEGDAPVKLDELVERGWLHGS